MLNSNVFDTSKHYPPKIRKMQVTLTLQLQIIYYLEGSPKWSRSHLLNCQKPLRYCFKNLLPSNHSSFKVMFGPANNQDPILLIAHSNQHFKMRMCFLPITMFRNISFISTTWNYLRGPSVPSSWTTLVSQRLLFTRDKGEQPLKSQPLFFLSSLFSAWFQMQFMMANSDDSQFSHVWDKNH